MMQSIVCSRIISLIVMAYKVQTANIALHMYKQYKSANLGGVGTCTVHISDVTDVKKSKTLKFNQSKKFYQTIFYVNQLINR